MDARHLLIILDGYGIAEDPTVSAIERARKPILDELFSQYPHARLKASGLAVGLPRGQMGNSEVGHMNLGAGRIVYQDITRIDGAIEEGSFFQNSVLVKAVRQAIAGTGRLHLIGLLSDGGVHSHIEHLLALLDLAARGGMSGDSVLVHAFTDGRDTDPHGGRTYVERFRERATELGVGRIASVVGRYWAMDRDKRWSRTESAYRLLVEGLGERFSTADSALESSYAHDVTDEFVKPCTIGSSDEVERSRIQSGDVVLCFNFRADRIRQISLALTETGFGGFERTAPSDLDLVTFTSYHHSFNFPVAFPKDDLSQTIGEVISASGGRQLRAAETEKYPHVTYFFSGGREEPFDGEDRILIPSPKVATYDLQPEMSAPKLAEAVVRALGETEYRLVVLNFANPDMVGHTGVFDAAVKAVEAVDAATGLVVAAARENGYSISIIADHGNSDRMRNPDGTPHTAHTTVRVPHLIIKDGFHGPIRDGKLSDIAPTILTLLGMSIPEEMTGSVLV
jgi:2,3-bisphosphoglycerate-independent phosphoglycerate mutase